MAQNSYINPPTTASTDVSRYRRQASSEQIWQSSAGGGMQRANLVYQKWRVGAPTLKLLPLHTALLEYRASDESIMNFLRPLYPTIEQILRRYEIDFESYQFAYRFCPSETPDGHDITLYIQAFWSEPDSANTWRSAVQALRDMLQENDLEDRIIVEMLAAELWRTKYIGAIEHDNPFVEAYNNFYSQKVYDIISRDSNLFKAVQSLDIIRLGFSSNVSSNPIVLSFSMAYTIDSYRWEGCQAELERMLREERYQNALSNVKVEFEHGEVNYYARYVPEGVNEELDSLGALTEKPNYTQARPGSSISGLRLTPLFDDKGNKISELAPGRGTLGVFLRGFKNGQYFGTFALTTYHVVRFNLEGFFLSGADRRSKCTAESSHAQKCDKKGLNPLDKVHPVYVSPARKLLLDYVTAGNAQLGAYQVDLARLRIQRPQTSETRSKIERYLELIKGIENAEHEIDADMDAGNDILGKLWLGSGFNRRTKANGRLDYALIRINDDKVASCANDFLPWRMGEPKPAPFISKLKGPGDLYDNIEGPEALYKFGGTTRDTLGYFSQIKSNVRMDTDYPNQPLSTEFCVVGTVTKPFSLEGDSGAAVFGSDGTWFGILFGGTVKLGARVNLTYMTPAKAILEDLAEFCNTANPSGDKFEFKL